MAVNELLKGEVELWRNGQWRVTNMHLEEIADPEVFGPPYWIPLDDIHIGKWPEHVCGKTWVDPEQFIEAYRKACELAGVKSDEASIARALDPEPYPFDLVGCLA
jgi:hypothetical protein